VRAEWALCLAAANAARGACARSACWWPSLPPSSAPWRLPAAARPTLCAGSTPAGPPGCCAPSHPPQPWETACSFDSHHPLTPSPLSPQIYVFCCAHADQIKKYLADSKWLKQRSPRIITVGRGRRLHLLVLENCLPHAWPHGRMATCVCVCVRACADTHTHTHTNLRTDNVDSLTYNTHTHTHMHVRRTHTLLLRTLSHIHHATITPPPHPKRSSPATACQWVRPCAPWTRRTSSRGTSS
jgi:hypothetical protein